MTTFIHPERAALLADEPQDSSDSAVSTRQDRIDRELVEMLQRPAKGPTSIQGIGLYTHAAAPKTSDTGTDQASKATFLPIGRPEMTPQDENGPEPPVSEDVRRVWYELREAVNQEEEHVGHLEMSVEQLKERYGTLDVPNGSASTAQSALTQQQLQHAFETLRRLRQATALSKDVATGGTNADSTGVAATSTNTAPRGNEYHEARDPRKRL